jgi:hypothetical protein
MVTMERFRTWGLLRDVFPPYLAHGVAHPLVRSHKKHETSLGITGVRKGKRLPEEDMVPMRYIALMFVVLTLVFSGPGSSRSWAEPTDPGRACDPGPVGWDVFRRLDLLPMIRCGVETKQFSSFNRDGGNVDGQKRYACYRTDPEDGCVIAEAVGPGEIDSIWFTRNRGNISANGEIRIDIDGERVVEAPLTDLVNGALGPPFVFPLVANADQTSGGNYVKVPMPFTSSMQISIDDVNYYHVTWRSFSEDGPITAFDPADQALDVIEMLEGAGDRDPKPGAASEETSGDFSLEPGDAVSIAAPDGPGTVREIALRLPAVESLRPVPQVWEETPVLADAFRDQFAYDYYPNYVPDTTSHELDGMLEDVRLRISFDGVTSVDVPVGEFFGAGTGEYDVPTLLFSMTTDADGAYRAWWPMPYVEGAEVELVNNSTEPVAGELTLLSEGASSVTEALNEGRAAYFGATSARAETELGRDFVFLEAPGQGHLVGVTHTMWPGPYQSEEHRANGLIRTYLEGDERIYSDGSRTPQLHGTGNEDFYEGGWYYNRSVFANPLNGNPVHEQTVDGCEVGCTGSYRLLLGDAVTFGDGIRFGIEVGAMNDEIRTYGSTAYWYGLDDPAYDSTDSLDIGNKGSEGSHRFTWTGEAVELTATFEGDDDGVEVTDEVVTSDQPTSFVLRTHPRNQGVRIRRTSDQGAGPQAVRVLVDGKDAGIWLQPLSNTFHRWRDDTFDVPAALTAGKSSLSLTLTPLEGTAPWSAAGYEALTRISPTGP